MSRATSTTIGLLIGGAVGAVTALMLAPKRGEEMRSDMVAWGRDAEHKAADKIRAAGSTVASGIRQVPGYVSEKAPQVASKVTGMFHRGEHEMHEGAEQVAGKVEKGSQNVAYQMDRQAEGM